VAFLQTVLADGPVPVPEIETRARAAGLLGARQRVTHAKRFKRAKAMLGIQSVPKGFGGGGAWAWALPSTETTAATASADHLSSEAPVPAIQIEPESVVAYSDSIATVQCILPKVAPAIDAELDLPPAFRDIVGVPRGCLEGIARLNRMRHPSDVPPHRWALFVTDCQKFICSTEGWAQRAVNLGWDAFSLLAAIDPNP
jgi:hypothetical protein